MLNIHVLQANPDEPVSVARVTIIMKYADKYQSYPELWSDVVESIGDYSALEQQKYLVTITKKQKLSWWIL